MAAADWATQSRESAMLAWRQSNEQLWQVAGFGRLKQAGRQQREAEMTPVGLLIVEQGRAAA